MTSHDIDVIISAHDLGRYAELRAAVASVQAQTQPPGSIVVVVDHAPRLFERAAQELGVLVVENDGVRGASGARNAGARAAHGGALAFLDDDAVADPGWVAALARHLDGSAALGVAGRILPLWRGREPRWFPPEFLWLVGASYRGQPNEPVRVRNAWSGNMAVRREAFDAVGGFREGFGKLGGVSSPEDTEFSLRVNRLAGGPSWISAPDAVVHHAVPAARADGRFFVRRCFAEGRGKALLRSLTGDEAVRTETSYVRTTLPRGFLAGFVDAATGDPAGLARAGAIVVGLGSAAAGYAFEMLRGRISPPPEGAVRRRSASRPP